MEEQISIRLSTELLEALDEWRQKHPLKPSRAQSIRFLVEAHICSEETIGQSLSE